MRMIFYINYSSKQINILYTASKKRTPRTAWVRKIAPNSIIRVSDTGKAETRADLPWGTGVPTPPPPPCPAIPLKKILVFYRLYQYLSCEYTTYYIETTDYRIYARKYSSTNTAGHHITSTFLNFCPNYKYCEDKVNE